MSGQALDIASIDNQRRAVTTYRVEAVPSGTSAASLLLYFHESDRGDITVHSLAPVADSDDGTGDLVATISFVTYDGSTRMPYLFDEDCELSIDREFYGFTPLNALHHPPFADVVAITGIGCHAFDSWASSSQKMWLRDHLHNDIPQVRVLLYGCHTSFNAPHGTLIEQAEAFVRRLGKLLRPDQFQKGAQRPLILIGHDIGCLVIKKAIEIGAASALSDVPCLVFFGAPHVGLPLNEITLLIGSDPLPAIVEELSPGSATLRELDVKFGSLVTQTSIIECETQDKANDTRSHDTSTIAWTPKTQLHCRADRVSIGKVRRTEAGPYWPVVGELTQALHSWTLRRASRSETNRDSAATSASELSSTSMAAEDSTSICSLPELPGSHNDTMTALSRKIDKVQGVQSQPKRNAPETSSSLRPSDLLSAKSAAAIKHSSPEYGGLPSIEPSPEIQSQGGNIQPISLRNKEAIGISPLIPPNRIAQYSQRGPAETWILPHPAVELAADASTSSRQSYTLVSSSPATSPSAALMLLQTPERHEQSPIISEEIEGSGLISLERVSEVPQRVAIVPDIDEQQIRRDQSISNPRNIGDKNANIQPITRRPTMERVLSRFRSRRRSSETGDMLAATLFGFVKQNDVQEVEALIASGIDVNVASRYDDYKTAIHYAAAAGHAEMITALLSKGARANSKSIVRRTPLHDAAAQGDTRAINILLEANADVNAADKEDVTPLHLAALNGHLEAVRILVRNRANWRDTRDDGKTALQLSINRGHSRVSKYLERVSQQDDVVKWPGLF